MIQYYQQNEAAKEFGEKLRVMIEAVSKLSKAPNSTGVYDDFLHALQTIGDKQGETGDQPKSDEVSKTAIVLI